MATMDSGGSHQGSQLHFPATERNKDPILEQLRTVVTPQQPQRMLEIASGSGQHAVYFSSEFPSVQWIPSECDASCLSSIRAYRADAKLGNFEEPLCVDVTADPGTWGVGGQVNLMLNVNMIHISPWQATVGLFRGAGHHLKSGGFLLTYGPYAFNGQLSPDSNVRFNASLRAQDSSWGIRDVADLEKLAADNNMKLHKAVPLPANNHVLFFTKS